MSDPLDTEAGDLVLVTGASGFIAKHVIRGALERGYRVRGTLRRPTTEAEVRAAVGGDGRRLSFATADLLSDTGWPEAVTGCRFVLHVAGVFTLVAPRDRDALVPLARDGTLRVLRHAAMAGAERIVITSSCVAVWAGHPPDAARVLTEADWSLVDAPETDAYARSKTMAEQAAWTFAKERGGRNPTLVAINPSHVMGPPLDRDVEASAGLVLMLLRGQYPFVPDWGVELVDVRDVAEAHLAALEIPEAGGRRFIASGGPLTLREMGHILGREFPAFRRRMPRGTLPNPIVRLLAFVDPGARQIVPDLGPVKRTSTQAAQEVLGLRFRPAEEALVAMARRLIELDMLA